MRSILVAEPGTDISNGLRELWSNEARPWEAIRVESQGDVVLAELDAIRPDAIVIDVSRLDRKGTSLLEEVERRDRRVARIALSDRNDVEAELRAAPVAHQFIRKPVGLESLTNAIERACDLQSFMEDSALHTAVDQIDALPSLPRIYHQLLAALADPDSTMKDVADIIEQDIALTAKILQIVNSTLFSGTATTANIQRAVTRLGLEMIANLALSVEVCNLLPPEPITDWSMDVLQRNALAGAKVARTLASSPHAGNDAFTAAMLRDIGQLVLAAHLPSFLQEAILKSRADQIPLHAVELDLYGTTHAEIGGYLLGVWKLPYPIVEAVAHHHEPHAVRSRGLDTLTIVHVADAFVQDTTNAPPAYPDSRHPYLDKGHLELAGVSEEVERQYEELIRGERRPGSFV